MPNLSARSGSIRPDLGYPTYEEATIISVAQYRVELDRMFNRLTTVVNQNTPLVNRWHAKRSGWKWQRKAFERETEANFDKLVSLLEEWTTGFSINFYSLSTDFPELDDMHDLLCQWMLLYRDGMYESFASKVFITRGDEATGMSWDRVCGESLGQRFTVVAELVPAISDSLDNPTLVEYGFGVPDLLLPVLEAELSLRDSQSPATT